MPSGPYPSGANMVYPFPSQEPTLSYYNLGCAMVWPNLMLWTKRDWRGQQFLGNPGEGVVVAANHLSWFDPLLLLHYSNDANRPARFLAKDSLFNLPMLGTVMTGAGAIPVKRTSADAAAAVESAVAAVEAGEAVWVYPEGTITRDPDLWPMTGKTGAARIALESGAPVIPVAHWGVQELMGPYKVELNLIPRKTIHVEAGPPVNLDDLRDRPITEAILQVATNRILDTITNMEAELRGEDPPKGRWSMKEKERVPIKRSL
ncbi:MAG: lysophospholipid acyltransferase family protein [Candidatus Nanopelagicales bacterium]